LFNDIRSFLPSFNSDSGSGMAPKETKKDRERRLKKAEEQLRGAEAQRPRPTPPPTARQTMTSRESRFFTTRKLV
jgi:hypothetical protein